MARPRRRSSPAQRRARAVADVSFLRFREEIIELDLEVGPVETRIASALERVRQALRRQEAAELARYTGLAPAYDSARQEVGGEAAALVAHLERAGGPVAELIGWMRLADEAIPHGLGIPALAALLIAPPRFIELDDIVVLTGLFCTRDRPEDCCAVLARWRITRGPSYVEAAIIGIDEPGPGNDAIANLLIELAYESHATTLVERARAALLVSPDFVAALEDLNDFTRRLAAAAAVRDVAVQLVAVTDERDLHAADEVLHRPELDILFIWVDPAAQWAWRRASEFGDHGGQLIHLQVGAGESAAVLAEINRALTELISGGDIDEASGSTLSARERDEIVAAGGAKVVFVGGNETQAQYHRAIEADIEALYGSDIVIAWFEGWGSSWNAIERAAHAQMTDADAVVVMTMVRTLLGASVRRRAGELDLPWVSCQGTGRQSLMASIEEALLVIARSDVG
jgi:hypothetical protein